MAIRFSTTSEMELDSIEDLKKVIALMPWSPEDKEAFFETHEYAEDDEAELDGIGAVDTIHRFTFKEV